MIGLLIIRLTLVMALSCPLLIFFLINIIYYNNIVIVVVALVSIISIPVLLTVSMYQCIEIYID